jgi:hypothetical protein
LTRIEHVLRRLEAELVLPEPVRTRALLEIGSDLEEAYYAYRGRGLSDAEAAERAAALLGVNAATAGELSRVHMPRYAAWLSRLAQRPRRWESVLLTLVTLGALGGGVMALRDAAVLRTGGLALWLQCAIAAALLWHAGAVARAVFSASASRGPKLEERLARLPLLASIAAIAGALSAATLLWHSSAGAADVKLGDVVAEIERAAEVMTLALSSAVCALLAWFHLYRRVAALRLMQRELQRIIDGSKEEV